LTLGVEGQEEGVVRAAGIGPSDGGWEADLLSEVVREVDPRRCIGRVGCSFGGLVGGLVRVVAGDGDALSGVGLGRSTPTLVGPCARGLFAAWLTGATAGGSDAVFLVASRVKYYDPVWALSDLRTSAEASLLPTLPFLV
jgi:hypothetical protein